MNSVYHYFYFKKMYKRNKKNTYKIITSIVDENKVRNDSLDESLSLSSENFMNKIDKICDIKLTHKYNYKGVKTNNLLELLKGKNEKQCCLCGLYKSEHKDKSHVFVRKELKYTCKNCGKYFYEHDHYNKPCFDPYVRL